MNFGSVEDAVGQGTMSLTSLFRKATNLLGFGGDDSKTRPPPIDGEIIYCKNNVCVHPPSSLNKSTSDHFPGYLNIRSQDDEVCIFHWSKQSKQSKAKMCNGRRHVPQCPASANEK